MQDSDWEKHQINMMFKLWEIIVSSYQLAEQFPEDESIPFTYRQYIHLLYRRIDEYQEFLNETP